MNAAQLAALWIPIVTGLVGFGALASNIQSNRERTERSEQHVAEMEARYHADRARDREREVASLRVLGEAVGSCNELAGSSRSAATESRSGAVASQTAAARSVAAAARADRNRRASSDNADRAGAYADLSEANADRSAAAAARADGVRQAIEVMMRETPRARSASPGPNDASIYAH